MFVCICVCVCVPVGPLISFHPMQHYGSERRPYARRLGKPYATLVVLRCRQHSDLISNPKREASVAAGCVRDSVTTRSVLCMCVCFLCVLVYSDVIKNLQIVQRAQTRQHNEKCSEQNEACIMRIVQRAQARQHNKNCSEQNEACIMRIVQNKTMRA